MKVFGFNISKEEKVESVSAPKSTDTDFGLSETTPPIVDGNWIYGIDTTSNPIVHDIFDGEKTPGELGAVYDTSPDHIKLRLRAYDMNLKTDIIQIITSKFFKWVVGSGLKLSAEPNKKVLEIFNIKDNLEDFKEISEALFNQYAKSEEADYHGNEDLHDKANQSFSTSFLGGDCLNIIRFDDDGPNMQVIDGLDVSNPIDDKGKGEGNTILKGVERDKKGHHVAFWVATASDFTIDAIMKHERVVSHNEYGLKVAWLTYGKKDRVGQFRGIPVITPILEKVAKLDRFVEASVSKAEQVANLVYAFEHNLNGTGENILNNNLTGKKSGAKGLEESYEKSGRTANQLRQSTSGSVLNLAPGSTLRALANDGETHFQDFFKAVFISLCAAVDIPEEIALQKYDSNYSASRAAINGWEYVVNIYRDKFAKDFYIPFYKAWLFHKVFVGDVNFEGLKNSILTKNKITSQAFYTCRFMGKKMPHIDPLKEAKAIREMVGNKTIPFMSLDQASETLNLGDWNENYKRYKKEYSLVDDEHKISEKQIIAIENENNKEKGENIPLEKSKLEKSKNKAPKKKKK